VYVRARSVFLHARPRALAQTRILYTSGLRHGAAPAVRTRLAWADPHLQLLKAPAGVQSNQHQESGSASRAARPTIHAEHSGPSLAVRPPGIAASRLADALRRDRCLLCSLAGPNMLTTPSALRPISCVFRRSWRSTSSVTNMPSLPPSPTRPATTTKQHAIGSGSLPSANCPVSSSTRSARSAGRSCPLGYPASGRTAASATATRAILGDKGRPRHLPACWRAERASPCSEPGRMSGRRGPLSSRSSAGRRRGAPSQG